MGQALADVSDLFLPATCACCGTYGKNLHGRKDLCPRCDYLLRHSLLNLHRPQLRSAQPTCVASGLYEHEVAAAVLAFKNGGRTDLTPYLATGLTRAISALLEEQDLALLRGKTLVLVPMPSEASSLRKRGYSPAEELARYSLRQLRANLPPQLAGVGSEIKVVPALKKKSGSVLSGFLGREGPGQKTLGVEDRFRRMSHSLAPAQPPGGLLGFRYDLSDAACILVDDVVTTGATLSAAYRLLQPLTTVLGASTVAAVPRRFEGS
ncbi:ComF family protein [Rothia aerolata]|uniref:ComF family protein n=1 Tax=Rothia aerolata TaxID=1812262 RepID=A0A917IPM4_9MICC|nr:ComF family protein [Rothia aerolata]GGH59520.1 hypothetical protein GCM10007359_06780 [Rothia aerolata]